MDVIKDNDVSEKIRVFDVRKVIESFDINRRLDEG